MTPSGRVRDHLEAGLSARIGRNASAARVRRLMAVSSGNRIAHQDHAHSHEGHANRKQDLPD